MKYENENAANLHTGLKRREFMAILAGCTVGLMVPGLSRGGGKNAAAIASRSNRVSRRLRTGEVDRSHLKPQQLKSHWHGFCRAMSPYSFIFLMIFPFVLESHLMRLVVFRPEWSSRTHELSFSGLIGQGKICRPDVNMSRMSHFPQFPQCLSSKRDHISIYKIISIRLTQ
jgi:hypothetical protein